MPRFLERTKLNESRRVIFILGRCRNVRPFAKLNASVVDGGTDGTRFLGGVDLEDSGSSDGDAFGLAQIAYIEASLGQSCGLRTLSNEYKCYNAQADF